MSDSRNLECGLPDVGAGIEPGPLQEQLMLLAAKPFLQVSSLPNKQTNKINTKTFIHFCLVATVFVVQLGLDSFLPSCGVPGAELKLAELAADTFTHWATSLALP